MLEPSRYRIEEGIQTIDVRVRAVEQVFDNRDPAPFRDRDLDPALAEYLLDAGEDLLGAGRIRVVFWLERLCERQEIEVPFRAHFRDVIARSRRDRRRQRRVGGVALTLAVLLMVALVVLSQMVGNNVDGALGLALREGLLISSWVVLWRPVELLVYEWIPAWHRRRIADKLLAASIDVRTGSPAAPA